jgi:hypothetical protein
MGQFETSVGNIIDTIAKSHRARKDDAERLAAAAEKMFSNVSTFVRELKPALVEKFPDLEPDVEIGSWTKSGVDAVNTIRLKRNLGGKYRLLSRVGRFSVLSRVLLFHLATTSTFYLRWLDQVATSRRREIDAAIGEFDATIGAVTKAIKEASVSLTLTSSPVRQATSHKVGYGMGTEATR